MVRRLLIAAAVVAAAAAAGEYNFVLGGTCGCGNNGAGIQTYSTMTAAYCPTSSYPTCDITKMVEQECKISCPHARSTVVYRNNSAIWQSTASISCIKNADGTSSMKNADGATVFNLMRPTCGFKAACDQCSIAYHSTCPTGMTCKPTNLDVYEGTDSCGRLRCRDNSLLKLYDTNGLPMAYPAKELFCTVVGKWTNYSVDGSIVGGTLIDQPFTANCVLPKACEECVAPQSTKNVSQLPVAFRTGYEATDLLHHKEAGSCALAGCPDEYTLYGFKPSPAANATGLENTSKQFLKCDGNSQWTNGGSENTPQSMLFACLKPLPTTTVAPPTTVNPCGPHDPLITDGPATFVCKDGQTRLECTGNNLIEILDVDRSHIYEKMTFVAGKGWLTFDCTGEMKLWKNPADIVAVVCTDG